MSEGIHYGILINPPKSPPITVEQFHKLSFIGLGSFMVNFPLFFEEKEEEIILYCQDYKANYYHEMPRFKEVIPGRINQAAELGYFNIPKNTELYKSIKKYFSHLFLTNE